MANGLWHKIRRSDFVLYAISSSEPFFPAIRHQLYALLIRPFQHAVLIVVNRATYGMSRALGLGHARKINYHHHALLSRRYDVLVGHGPGFPTLTVRWRIDHSKTL